MLRGADGLLVEDALNTPPTIAPAQAAESPPLTQAPAGAVRPLTASRRRRLFDGRTRQLAVLCPGSDTPNSGAPASLVTFAGRADIAAGHRSAGAGDRVDRRRRRHRLPCPPAAATSWSIWRPAAPTRVQVGDAANIEFTAIARRADGRLVLGTADGAVYTLASGKDAGAP